MTVSVNRYIIPAAGLRIQSGGNFFFLMDSSSPVDVQIIRSASVIGTAKGIGSGFRYGPAKTRFDELQITPTDGVAGSVQLAISEDPIDYRAPSGHVDVSGSSVTVSDGLISIARPNFNQGDAASAFAGVTNSSTMAGSSVLSFLNNPSQIPNPIVIAVTRLIVFAAAGPVFAYIENNSTRAGGVVAQSKLSDGQASQGTIGFSYQPDGQHLNLALPAIFKVSVKGEDIYVDFTDSPILLMPQSCLVLDGPDDAGISVSWEWSERAV